MHLSKLPSARYETNQFVQHNLNFLLFLPTVLSQTYYPLCKLKWHSLTVTVVYLYEADVLVWHSLTVTVVYLYEADVLVQ